jgi:hypothetical protein
MYINMTSSILESKYVEPTRPYSQNELRFNRDKLKRNYRLSKNRAHHKRCNHFYLVRVNGRKEREMIDTESDDVGNCSVCWKISKTQNFLKERAQELVHHYSENFETDPELMTYRLGDIETMYYNWLYEDQQYRRRPPRNAHFAREDNGDELT